MKKNNQAAKTPAMRDGIREFVRKNPRCNMQDVADSIGKGRTTARYHLTAMVEAGQIIRNAGGKYLVV